MEQPHHVQVSEFLTEFFQHRIIALNHPIEWPPRSHDITPCDYFLWGYLKNNVYVSAPTNMEDLMQRIRRETDALKRDPQLVRAAVRGMVRRMELCIHNKWASC